MSGKDAVEIIGTLFDFFLTEFAYNYVFLSNLKRV